jgi:hypothetical protein
VVAVASIVGFDEAAPVFQPDAKQLKVIPRHAGALQPFGFPEVAPKSNCPKGAPLTLLLSSPRRLQLAVGDVDKVAEEILPSGLFSTNAVRKPPMAAGVWFVRSILSVADDELEKL